MSSEKKSSSRRIEGFLRTGYLIHDVSRLRRLFYDQQSRPLGITRAQWWVLFNLARHDGEPLNQNELAKMIELGSAAVGELIMRLEKAGFVERLSDPSDRRSKRVVIAPRGREVLDHMKRVARDSQAPIMAGISPDEQDVLNDLLSRMKKNLISLHAESDASDDMEIDTIPGPAIGRDTVNGDTSAPNGAATQGAEAYAGNRE